MKRIQKWSALLMAVTLLFTLAAPAALAAESTVTIKTAGDLMELSRNCTLDTWSQGKTVILENDLDLHGVDFTPIPTFSGTFQGNGHTISGLSITGSGNVRGLFRYAEQSCNHFIAFKLLALIRDKVFRALRRLCPAKLEGRDRGDLISVITSDIELLEVFYAHTISPAAIAVLFTVIMCLFIGHYHALLSLLALAAYVCVGVVIPLITSRRSGDTGMRFRTESGALSAFVLDSLRGLNETIQYDRGAERRAEMDARTDALSKEEAKLKRLTGQNMGITNTAILLFDLAMLVSSAALVQRGELTFAGALIAVLAEIDALEVLEDE